MDVIEIDGASNTGVNDVRQIKDEVLFPPNAGRYKVYIIDEVHMLSNNAFNALLKTIEEPPPYIVFIFATTELHKVPATIKSRCQQFNFRQIPVETIQAVLKTACADMKIEAEDEALFWIAKEATGSLRDAYTLFDQVVSFSGDKLQAALIREKLGIIGLDKLNALAECCIRGETAGALDLAEAILESGIALEQFILDMVSYYHSLLFIKAGITRESILGYPVDRFSAAVQGALNQARLEYAQNLLFDLYRDIRYSVSPRFELETVISKLCWLDRWVTPEELTAAIAGAREALGGSFPAASGAFTAPAAGAGEGGLGRPLAGPGEGPRAELSLTEGFERFMAAKASQTGADGAEGETAEAQIDPQVETVLRVFRGTLV
jgi:DNA polymerase-3 subunit gamma/tau